MNAATLPSILAEPWSQRFLAERAFEQRVEDLVCDLACLTEPRYAPRIAYELALAERMGICSVWIHGLWRHRDGRWENLL